MTSRDTAKRGCYEHVRMDRSLARTVRYDSLVPVRNGYHAHHPGESDETGTARETLIEVRGARSTPPPRPTEKPYEPPAPRDPHDPRSGHRQHRTDAGAQDAPCPRASPDSGPARVPQPDPQRPPVLTRRSEREAPPHEPPGTFPRCRLSWLPRMPDHAHGGIQDVRRRCLVSGVRVFRTVLLVRSSARRSESTHPVRQSKPTRRRSVGLSLGETS